MELNNPSPETVWNRTCRAKMTCLMWSAVVYSLVWVMSETFRKIRTRRKRRRTYLGKSPSPNRPHGPPNHSTHRAGTTSPSGDSYSDIQVSMGPKSSSDESTQTNQTIRNGEAGFDGRMTQRPTSWIISRKFMTVVLVGAAFAEEGVPSEFSCFTPHPASASQFRTAPGSHPRFYPGVNITAERSGHHDERYHELHDVHVSLPFRHFRAIRVQ